MAAAAETSVALSPRQRDVLFYLRKGMRNAEIGTLLGIKERTVKMYVHQLFDIFDVTNRTELAGSLRYSDEAGLRNTPCTEVHVHKNVGS